MKKKARSENVRKWQARKGRIRKQLAHADRTWLTVYRSSKHIYAQLVDPQTGHTLATVSTRSPGLVGDASTSGVEAARKVGEAIAGVAREKNIEKVVFNRNGFLYHGRIKALADGAREAGLSF